ncbi:unnamed protein product [Notodromas monacha]|uniref:Uncharacterized protein n=1 Tax=Notodromas monacha TaxID=399045 RepID=A0A7R9BEC7_9CRUS|nr:unnamed protein product [Notodromas monacha]CAG0913826.1 unnamed protein product [Notodromas monacha]
MAGMSSTSSSSVSSGDDVGSEELKIREAVAPGFENVFATVSASIMKKPRNGTVPVAMEVCRHGLDPSAESASVSVREKWELSRQVPEPADLKVTKGFQNHVAMKLGTIIDSSIKEVNKNLSTIHLGEHGPTPLATELGGIRIFSDSHIYSYGESDGSELTNVELLKDKDDSETDRTKGLTESEVLSDKDLTVRKRKKRKKRRPNKEVDYQSESACELPDPTDFGPDGVVDNNVDCEMKPAKKRKRVKETACFYQKKTKRRKLDTDSGGDGDVSSDTDSDYMP